MYLAEAELAFCFLQCVIGGGKELKAQVRGLRTIYRRSSCYATPTNPYLASSITINSFFSTLQCFLSQAALPDDTLLVQVPSMSIAAARLFRS